MTAFLLTLIHIVHIHAQMPKASAPGNGGEHCSTATRNEEQNAQELTSPSSSSTFQNLVTQGTDPAVGRENDTPMSQLAAQPMEDWMHLKEDATYEIRRTLEQLVQVGEEDIAGEVAYKLREALEAPRGESLVDKCYVGCTYQAIDVCVKTSLRHRRRGGIELSEGWMDTVHLLEMGIYRAASARARNYYRAQAAAEQRRQHLLRMQPRSDEGDGGSTAGSASHRCKSGVSPSTTTDDGEGSLVTAQDTSGSVTPRKGKRKLAQGEEGEHDEHEVASLVTTTSDTSRTPRRTAARRPVVTESTVWLTPEGAFHNPPPSTPHAPAAPTTTEEAIDLWLGLLGLSEEPTDSLPTSLSEAVQTRIRATLRDMPPRAIGLLRRSLPLCLNEVQDEVMELIRASSTSSCSREDGAAASSRHGGRASTDPPTRPAGGSTARERGNPRSAEHAGESSERRANMEEEETVEVVIDPTDTEEGESDSTMWLQTRKGGVPRNLHEENEQEWGVVVLVQHGVALSSPASSSSSNSSSSSPASGTTPSLTPVPPDEEQEIWNKYHGREGEGRPEYPGLTVMRQTWWEETMDQVLRSGNMHRVPRKAWLWTAQAIRARGFAEYDAFANVLLDFLGGHLTMEVTYEEEILPQQMQAIANAEAKLWDFFRELSESQGPTQRSRWWRVNNKPSWALSHPMGVMAAQWVEGDRYGCRCVRTPDGTIVAVEDKELEKVRENLRTDKLRSQGAQEEGTTGQTTNANGGGNDETAMMQKTLTRMLGQQGRTRVVLQGLNYRLCSLGSKEASRRAKALLVRLTRAFSIATSSRPGLHELIQDAEATLASHVDPDLVEAHFGTQEDCDFVEGWWVDLHGALSHDLQNAPSEPLRSMTPKEVQEIEHDLESQADQDRAKEQWDAYMEEQGEDRHERTPAAAEARAYQQWEDWAMWNEMHNGGARKRRLHVEVQFGSNASSSSSTARASLNCPAGWNGTEGLQVCLRVEPSPGTPTTVAATVPEEEKTTQLYEPGDTGEGHRPVGSGNATLQVTVPETCLDTASLTVVGASEGRRNATQASSTVPWGVPGDSLVDPVTMAEIEVFAEQLRLEYAEREHREQAEGGDPGGFENFLVSKATNFLDDMADREGEEAEKGE